MEVTEKKQSLVKQIEAAGTNYRFVSANVSTQNGVIEGINSQIMDKEGRNHVGSLNYDQNGGISLSILGGNGLVAVATEAEEFINAVKGGAE